MNIGIGMGILAGVVILLWGVVVGVGLLSLSEMISLLFNIAKQVRPQEAKPESYPALRFIRGLYKVLAILVLVGTLLGFAGAIMAGACAGMVMGDKIGAGQKLDDLKNQMERLRQPNIPPTQ